jgi:hypothetical protein
MGEPKYAGNARIEGRNMVKVTHSFGYEAIHT